MKKKLLVVYGTLKKGQRNHRVMGDSTLLGAFETGKLYTMRTNGGFPIVERGGTTSIKGEVYEVNDRETLQGIYRLEGYTGEQGNQLNWYDTDNIVTPFGEAQIFVMPKNTNEQLAIIESGIF